LGANIISVTPGFQRAGGGFGFGGGFGQTTLSSNLTENDARIIKTTPGVLYVDGTISGRSDVSFSGETASISIQGVDTSVWKYMETTELQAGR
jgi:putative ABC transport system permease protein